MPSRSPAMRGRKVTRKKNVTKITSPNGTTKITVIPRRSVMLVEQRAKQVKPKILVKRQKDLLIGEITDPIGTSKLLTYSEKELVSNKKMKVGDNILATKVYGRSDGTFSQNTRRLRVTQSRKKPTKKQITQKTKYFGYRSMQDGPAR
ncbi:hypothetical protein KKG83_05940 [Candidatus Micrarchaeota archaeon]|nr:hypothetical protein [Candidatus Micrarchaeota archaeon]